MANSLRCLLSPDLLEDHDVSENVLKMIKGPGGLGQDATAVAQNFQRWDPSGHLLWHFGHTSPRSHTEWSLGNNQPIDLLCTAVRVAQGIFSMSLYSTMRLHTREF